MSRSSKKGPYIPDFLIKKVDKALKGEIKGVIKIWARRATIFPECVGLTFGVHNGQKHIPVFVNENMIGHKFGEFAPTRMFKGHSGNNKK